MTQLDLLVFGAHPDDAELGAAGTIASAVAEGKSVGIIDLTRGELGTRGCADDRDQEASKAAKILGVSFRENLGFADGFFENNKEHQLAIIKKIRKYRPKIVIANAVHDRHIDHGRGAKLVSDACFLSGLQKISTTDKNGNIQEAFRPKHIYHMIQWYDFEPDFVVDISHTIDKKPSNLWTAMKPFGPISRISYIRHFTFTPMRSAMVWSTRFTPFMKRLLMAFRINISIC